MSAEADRTGTIRMQGRAASRRADRAQPALAQLQRLEPLPSGAEALDEPFRAFPSWFLQIECECDRCGKVPMVNETHAARWRGRSLRDILARMRDDGCGGLASKAELLGHRGRVQAARCCRRSCYSADPPPGRPEGEGLVARLRTAWRGE